jgi:hypothetical protein
VDWQLTIGPFAASPQVLELDWQSLFVTAKGTRRQAQQSRTRPTPQASTLANVFFLPG